MSEAAPIFNNPTSRAGRIAIVASRYNAELVAGLVAATRAELTRMAPAMAAEVYEVPGAFEIPLMVREVLVADVAAVIALGVIIAGETPHAELVGRAVTDGLARLAVEFRVPVIHEVLLVANEAQARDRALGARNRGREAAQAAVGMIEALAAARAA